MICGTLRQRLREFFVDVTDANVDFHLGDLFDPSQFRLRDVFLKTELINALHLPFELKGAYIGHVKVEGVVGFVAGSPLTIGVDNVCLVLGHKPVDWNNDLALRYAKELLLAILQRGRVSAPSADKQKQQKEKEAAASEPSFSVSPVKWILSKIQATIAETTVKLDRLHIRFESEHEGQLIAYGLHIPTIQLSTRDLDDPILKRREQQGVTYPSTASDTTACKRLYLANISIYCDLHASSFLGPTPSKQTPTTPLGSTIGSSPAAALSPSERLSFLRQQCLTPFTPHADRDLFLISALWLKLDFVRGRSASPLSFELGAVDLVTDAVKVNIDLTQCAVLNGELARVTEFHQRERNRAWRPSSVDRDRVAPLKVTVSTDALLPVEVTADLAKQSLMSTPHSPRYLNRVWLRGMWRYAARCVLLAARNGNLKRVRLGTETGTDDERQQRRETDHRRYVALYTRSLNDENLKMIVFGRPLLPASPRAADTPPLPVYEPLTLAEQWELSDLVEKMTVRDLRLLRQEAAQRVRLDFESYEAESPTHVPLEPAGGRASSSRSLMMDSPDTRVESSTGRRTSGASISPSHSPRHTTPQASPSKSTTPLSLDFVANHHHQFTRSRAESSPSGSPTKLHSVSAPSPTFSPPQLTHSASAPIKLQKPSSPTAAKTAFIESLIPPWLLQPSRMVPLVNWHMGPLSLRLHHRKPETTAAVLISTTSSVSPGSGIPPRSADTFLDFHVEGCTGCALLVKMPSVSFLLELRVGLVRAALVDLASPTASTGNSLTTDYIRDPSDGFLYLGLKYNFKHTVPNDDDMRWDLKAKLCVGTVHIEYNDLALQNALRSDKLKRRASFSASFIPPVGGTLTATSLPHDAAAYATIIQDVLTNWKACVQHKTARAPLPPPQPDSAAKAKLQKAADQKERKRARAAKLVAALLHHASTVELATSGMELRLAMLTSSVVERVTKTTTAAAPLAFSSHFDTEQVHVTLPSASAGMETRPLLNECQLHAGGVRLKFQTTSRGRAAVVDHVLTRLFPVPKPKQADGFQ